MTLPFQTVKDLIKFWRPNFKELMKYLYSSYGQVGNLQIFEYIFDIEHHSEGVITSVFVLTFYFSHCFFISLAHWLADVLHSNMSIEGDVRHEGIIALYT